jgi:hypothetical protein
MSKSEIQNFVNSYGKQADEAEKQFNYSGCLKAKRKMIFSKEQYQKAISLYINK